MTLALQRGPLESQAFFGGRAILIPLSSYSDARGTLLPFDFAALPFNPRRVFLVHGVPAGMTRGGHAHKTGKQLLVCLAGKARIDMRWDGQSQSLALDRSDIGLLIEPGVWASQTYEVPGTILLVLASEPYGRELLIGDDEHAIGE
jgi:dTDP-4-dehydrorhamnose 3,5-epimerase-like enzyme